MSLSDLQQKSGAELVVADRRYYYYSLPEIEPLIGPIDRLPKSLKILLENLLRHLDTQSVQPDDIHAMAAWLKTGHVDREIAYHPARVLMQDFTGVPAIVDLAAMRAAVAELGGEVSQVNPLSPVDLVIDHSVTVDQSGHEEAFKQNVFLEMARNEERYSFLRWGQQAFHRLRVVPPGTGICHQVNLEYLGQTVWSEQQGSRLVIYPDTVVGTDSHTTMINGLGILGWGVGGIEAEAAMLGQPISMLIPDVVGLKLTGHLRSGITTTDLVLTVTEMLREYGVVDKFVEFYGNGLVHLSLADRATIANMTPEYGATCGFFPVDEVTLQYLRLTGRSDEQIALVEAYTKAQGMWRYPDDEPVFSSRLELDMSTVEASLAGPKRPQDRVKLSQVPHVFAQFCHQTECLSSSEIPLNHQNVQNGAVVIAAITSCTNTSNPSVMMAAGLLAKKAYEKGIKTKPWVKTSLAPGSKVVTEYLNAAGLSLYLNYLGFNLVGYGCTTCIGNSGALSEHVEQAIQSRQLTVAAVLSGNRNFEGRIHPLVKANWLASPPLVVAYALAGNMSIDLDHDPLGQDKSGNPVYLKDVWPSSTEIAEAVQKVTTTMFRQEYAQVFEGDASWQSIEVMKSPTYAWQEHSTYIRHPPYFKGMSITPDPIKDIKKARILAILGDSVTTDHISPAGNIKQNSSAGHYLQAQGVDIKDFNSYGSRRGNHEVMMRGTFANIRIRNEMVPGIEGGMTRHIPSQHQMSIYDAAMLYEQEKVPLVVIAGKEYGSGSSRDWAAKGPRLLGIRAVIAESFERIHRSNLIGMGILPLEFLSGTDRLSLSLTGNEWIDIKGLSHLTPGQDISVILTYPDAQKKEIKTRCRIDTHNELLYFKNGGILHYVIRKILSGNP
ncbi:aconitate hydratase AcnA [Candidatus Williamhamiltonella defendens]|uniref:aconitate hydratase AcnA n=1 Tax=Candidatus Williamhamiltonella defendens TaxID=138072 RepID=UPI001583E1D5|nr:aconitate hydratase AcnA [Candidatus Hamiltonella defensa]